MAVLKTQWHRDPKVQSAGLDGMGLHAWSISYCDDNETDGFVPAAALPRLARVKQALKAVVDVGLWHEAPGGYRVHQYLLHNRSRAQIQAARAKNAERKARGRDERNGHSPPESPPESPPDSGRESRRESGPFPVPVPFPDPYEAGRPASRREGLPREDAAR